MNDLDFDLFASWLRTTARETGQAESVRDLLRRAFSDAVKMYGLPTDHEDYEPDDMTVIISRFNAAWDESERQAREDEAAEEDYEVPVEHTIESRPKPQVITAPPPRDRLECEIGTQAARINELLTTREWQCDEDVFHKLVVDFPTATKALVYQHIRQLRRKLRALYSNMLEERREGGRVYFRLLPP